MLSLEAFNYIRDVFIFFIIILAILFIAVTFFKKRLLFINSFTVISISLICIVVSILNLIMLGYAADELNLSFRKYSTMFIVIVILSVLNSIIIFKNK